jgi:hypothetical protein
MIALKMEGRPNSDGNDSGSSQNHDLEDDLEGIILPTAHLAIVAYLLSLRE